MQLYFEKHMKNTSVSVRSAPPPRFSVDTVSLTTFSVEDINEHFLSVAQKTVSALPSSHTSPTSYIAINTDVSPLKLSEVDVQEVVECISHLDSHKAVGFDGIPAKFVKASPLCMAVLLTKLINKSIFFSCLSGLLEICCCNANSKITQ